MSARTAVAIVVILIAATPIAQREQPGAPAMGVGLAEIDITPPIGYRLDGNFVERLSTGQRDPLKAKKFRQHMTRRTNHERARSSRSEDVRTCRIVPA